MLLMSLTVFFLSWYRNVGVPPGGSLLFWDPTYVPVHCPILGTSEVYKIQCANSHYSLTPPSQVLCISVNRDSFKLIANHSRDKPVRLCSPQPLTSNTAKPRRAFDSIDQGHLQWETYIASMFLWETVTGLGPVYSAPPSYKMSLK